MCSVVTVICEIGLEIWSQSPQKLAAQIRPNFGAIVENFATNAETFVMANVCGLEQVIIDWKTALQTDIIPV